MNEKKPLEGSIIGSVAVDSETGMENYNQPKMTDVKTENTQGLTPNYGEKQSGDAQNLAGVPTEFMNLFEHDPSEVIYTQALRHTIGSITIYAAGILAVTLILIAYGGVVVGGDSFAKSIGVNSANLNAIGALVALLFVTLTLGITFVAAFVYKKSRLILTNQKVVLIQYHSLIAREVSQINIGEVEDVNVSQPSIFDRIFKTGKITIETAGEQNNYMLAGVERPYDFARKTIQMHEGSISEYGN